MINFFRSYLNVKMKGDTNKTYRKFQIVMHFLNNMNDLFTLTAQITLEMAPDNIKSF